jgi:hypothetical protein
MSAADNLKIIMEQLNKLIAQARVEKKWLWCHYQDLWFSPDELEAKNKAGQFQWGAVNWELRDPQEKLNEAKRRTECAKAAELLIENEIKGKCNGRIIV